LQKSARGVGLREATSVAAGVGDGGLARRRETAQSERTSGSASSGNGWRGEGPVEGCLLVEGVLGRGSSRPSRVGGGIGLGLSDRSALCDGPRRATGTSELRRSRVGGSQQLFRDREAAGRSESGDVNCSVLPHFEVAEAMRSSGARLKCGLQMSARRISVGCASELLGF
jgi:hypothetical protein